MHGELEPAGYMEAGWAPVWVYGINLTLPLVWALFYVVAWWRLRQRADVARAQEKSGDAAVVGGQRVVAGTVAELHGGPGVRITIEQAGSHSRYKQRHTTTWTEIGRRVEVSPFDLTTSSGRIRVEPNQRVKLADEIDRIERTTMNRRFQIAELRVGEPAIVLGRVESVAGASGGAQGGGYRSPSQVLVMRPADGEMLVSTESLDTPLRRAASQRATFAAMFIGVILVGQLMAARYHVARFAGHAETAVVVERKQVQVRSGKRLRTERFVVYRVVSTGKQEQVEIEEEDWPVLTDGTTVPVWVSPAMTTLGDRPTENGLLLALPLLLQIGVKLRNLRKLREGRAWYDGAPLVERRAGMLDDDWVGPDRGTST